MPPETSRLETEAKALVATAASASTNPFVPAAARDAITQAASVISLLAGEVTAMRHKLALLLPMGETH